MTDQTDGGRDEIPAGIALAWGRGPKGARGPKRSLSVGQVVAAGLDVAARDGVDGLSMGAVAKELGVSAMALYRYVPAKDDLLELMVDTALGRPRPATAGETWRDGLRRWAVGVRDSYAAHPWALRVPITAPPLGPNNVRWMENGLAALAATPLTAQECISCLLLISGFVRAEETLRTDTAAATEAGLDARYADTLRQLVDAAEFPHVLAAIEQGAMSEPEDVGLADEFEFGLERILDGIAVLVTARAL